MRRIGAKARRSSLATESVQEPTLWETLSIFFVAARKARPDPAPTPPVARDLRLSNPIHPPQFSQSQFSFKLLQVSWFSKGKGPHLYLPTNVQRTPARTFSKKRSWTRKPFVSYRFWFHRFRMPFLWLAIVSFRIPTPKT